MDWFVSWSAAKEELLDRNRSFLMSSMRHRRGSHRQKDWHPRMFNLMAFKSCNRGATLTSEIESSWCDCVRVVAREP